MASRPLLQEIQKRLPGREWNLTRPQAMDVATLIFSGIHTTQLLLIDSIENEP
jgi:hypothetical protein